MRSVLLVSTMVLAAATGCGEGCGCGEGDRGAAEDAGGRERAEAPDGLAWEASVSGAEALAALREQLPDRLRPVMPATPGALLERVAPRLPLADRIPDDATVWALAVDVGGGEHMVMAAPITVGDGALPLGPDLPVLSGAPHGGQWIGQVPGRDDDAAMLLDGVLLVSESPRAIEVAAPYLAFTRVPAGAPAGVRLRLPVGFVSEKLRRAADRLVSHQATRALAAARAERERHESPPTYGDPEALIAALRDVLRKLVAYLPDVGEVAITVGADEAGLAVAVEAAVDDGSPLAEALEGSSAGPPFGIAALPEDTALAWATRTERDAEPSFVATTLTAMGGDRLNARASEALSTVDRAVGESRGEGVVVALGSDGTRPWALGATAPTTGPLDADAVRRAVGAPYLRDVVGGLVGCEGPASPRRTGPTGTPLCPGADAGSPVLEVAQADRAWAVSVSRGSTAVADGTAARLAGDRNALGAHPDVARILSALGDEVLLVAVIVPSRVLPAAALLPFDALREAGDETAAQARPAPVVLAASRSDDGLRLEIRATAVGIEDLAAVIEPFLPE